MPTTARQTKLECKGTDSDGDYVIHRVDHNGKARCVAHVYGENVKDEILTAVNHHAALVEALRDVLREFVPSRDQFTLQSQEQAFDKARAVLAHVEGKG